MANIETSSRGTLTSPRARAASHSSYSPATALSDSALRSWALSEVRICSGLWRRYAASASMSTWLRRNIRLAGWTRPRSSPCWVGTPALAAT